MAQNSGRKGISCPSKLRPALIVFDLDHTLWPFTLEHDTCPPFRIEKDVIFDSRSRVIRTYPDVPAILKYLNEQKYRMAAASRTCMRPAAEELIYLLGWTDYLEQRELYRTPKTVHFKRLHEETKIAFKDMMFFDNDPKNIDAVSSLGVTCILVDEREGLTWEDLDTGFKAFAEKKGKAK